jgi:hypothetical protein
VFSFLKDQNGNSPARQECTALRQTHPKQLSMVLRHLARVEAAGGIATNRPLGQARKEAGTRGNPDLYWWDVNGVGAFYVYDSYDLVVVLMGAVADYAGYIALLNQARGRM